MKTKNHDFIEIEYIGKIKETNQIFDLTNEEVAKKNNLYNPNASYGPVIVCIGEGFVIKGFDKELENKELNKEYKIEIPAEQAFGKKDAKKIKLVPTSAFRGQKITPIPGLQVNMGGLLGVIRTVSGGRTLVDFNHPLAGRDIVYEFKINKIIIDDKEKIKSIFQLFLKKDIDVEIKESIANIKLDISLPKPLEKELQEKINKLVPKIKTVKFIKPKAEQKTKPKRENKKQPLKNN